MKWLASSMHLAKTDASRDPRSGDDEIARESTITTSLCAVSISDEVMMFRPERRPVFLH